MRAPPIAVSSSPAVCLSYRSALQNFTLEHWSEIDAFEVVVDHYLDAGDRQREMIEALVGRKPLVAHGVGLSLGTDVPLNTAYLDAVAAATDRLGFSYYSEHLAFTKVPGSDLATLLPLPRTRDVVRDIAAKIKAIRSVVPVPFILENIVTYFDYPDSVLGEAEFLVEVCEKSGAGILLDVENLYANDENNLSSAEAFIETLPSEFVHAVHTAGGRWDGDLFIDDHGHPISDRVFELLDSALSIHTPEFVILERDNRLNETAEIVADLRELHGRVDAMALERVRGRAVDALAVR
jgi:uncharacterized protein (UPF0276 family)